MLKPLLLILAIVTLIALALNFNFFSEPVAPKPLVEQAIEKEIVAKVTPKVIPTKAKIKIPKSIVENNLSQELALMLKKSETLYMNNKKEEALLVLDSIIKKSKDSNETKILHHFANACLYKASMYNSYSEYNLALSNESYELLANTLKTKNDKELLLIYMKARIQQNVSNTKEELLSAYDEVIEKFEKDKEQRFTKEVEELLFAKSFTLMGVNDEEAMDVLDSIISKYEDKRNLPNTVKFSILNNIELSIITANDAQKYVDLAEEYMADSPDTKPLLDMLSIIKNAQELEQSEALAQWKTNHKEYNFPDWDFSELRKWVNKMETPEAQQRIVSYLDVFERQKYLNYYQDTSVTTYNPNRNEQENENTAHTYPSNENSSDEEIQYDEIPAYEPDPYLNDIIDSQPELTYPNPYETTYADPYEPNPEADGASHTYEDEDDASIYTEHY